MIFNYKDNVIMLLYLNEYLISTSSKASSLNFLNLLLIYNFILQEHPLNISLISFTLLYLKLLRFNSFNDEHP